MPGFAYLALAVLILLLLPVVVMPWEGRRVPDALYVVLGASGIVAAAIQDGAGGAVVSGLTGLAAFALVTAFVTFIRITLNLRILTGGHIKLLATGATWLGMLGTLAMIGIAFGALFAMAVLRNRQPAARRPDFTVIAALAIVCVGIQQVLPQM